MLDWFVKETIENDWGVDIHTYTTLFRYCATTTDLPIMMLSSCKSLSKKETISVVRYQIVVRTSYVALR